MQLLRPKQIAAELGVTPQRVYRMIEDEQLPHIHMGRAIRIPREAWEQWLAAKTAEAMASVKDTRG